MAIDRRQKNGNWYVADELLDGSTRVRDQVREGAILATLMDLRDELQEIRRLIACPNVAAGFRAMRSIDRRLSRGIVTRPPAKKRSAKR